MITIQMVSLVKRLHFKRTCIHLFFIFVTIYCIGSFYWLLSQNYFTDPKFLEIPKCPVCFGKTMCPHMLSDEVIPRRNWLLSKSLEIWSSKNVIYSQFRENYEPLVVKKLATDRKLQDLDEKLCYDAKMPTGCDVTSAVSELDLVKMSVKDDSFSKQLQGSSPMFICPSTRLIEKLIMKYKEKSNPTEIILRDLIQILTTSQVNPEPLLFQAFPASDGWPFPTYHGACGRYVVVGDGGRPLSEFYHASWQKRADIAYQLMKIAEQLTNNKEEFALYLTDVTYDNFAVDVNGKVTLIDGEGVVVVDKRAVRSAKPAGWEDLHESTFTDCTGRTFKSCHSFSGLQLCSHLVSDHNYYAICRALLSKFADETDRAYPDGFLHDMPDSVKNEWDLEYLLTECAMPKRLRGRIQVVHKLIEALDSCRLNAPRVLNGG